MYLTETLNHTASSKPDLTAIIDGHTRYTWQTFAKRVAQLAGVLKNLSLSSRGRVAIVMQNSHRFLETYYAVPWAGGIFVPLNNRLTHPERIAILNDAGVEIILFDQAQTIDFPNLKNDVPSLKHGLYAGTQTPNACINYENALQESHPISDPCNGDVAALFYTGGTTGHPKGVMLTHKNISSNAHHLLATMQPSPNWIYLHAGPMYHIADGMWNATITQQAGIHVFVPTFEPELVLNTIETHRITHCSLVPTMVDLLINTQKKVNADLSSLRGILYGGAPMPQTTLTAVRTIMPTCEFYQGYGLTETSPILSILKWEHHHTEDKLKSVGQAVPGVKLQIIDEHDHPLPLGEIGEVVAQGPNVMKGYWQKPALTAETQRNGWMHTGDAGYLDQDGFLYIVDRLKDMIITGGENVYSAEVENALYQHPAVSSCAVIGIPHATWGEAVHAVVILKDGYPTTEKELITHCQTHIANYKCPRNITFQNTPLPTTGAGKISKRAIRDVILQNTNPKPDTSIWDTIASYPPEEQALQIQNYLQQHIGQLKKTDPSQLSNQNTLSELGLDSFMVAELTDKIQSELNISVSPDLFLQPIAQMTKHLHHHLEPNPHRQTQTLATVPTRSFLRTQTRNITRSLFNILTHLTIHNLHHIPHNGPCILASNHLHLLDATLLLSITPRPLAFVMHTDWNHAIINYIYQTIPVHHEKMSAPALTHALNIVKSGGALSIAPEGKRSDTLSLIKGQPGVAYLAIKSGTPIIPIGMWGARKNHITMAINPKRHCYRKHWPAHNPIRNKNRQKIITNLHRSNHEPYRRIASRHIPRLLCRNHTQLSPKHQGSLMTNPNKQIEKAMQSVQEAVPQAKQDPFRPVFHFRPPARWMNDPNGTMFHNGYYHVFYQHNPFGDTHGPMYWGHTRSKDLAHWEHLPIGLWPSHDQGETDCYSGCAWKNADGTPILIYTKVDKSKNPHPDFEQWAALPKDDDLIHWEKHPNNPIMEKQPEFGAHWRDPFVFSENGRTFAVVGACEVGTPLYEATRSDLLEWAYRGLMCDISTECPNFFKINEKYILLSSPYRPVKYHIGTFDANTPSFAIQSEGVLDHGEVNENGRMKNGFYASNICFNERNQCILFGWVRGWEGGRGWNGCLALPRLLTIDPQNRPRQIPVPALRELRDQHTHIAETDVVNTHVLPNIQSDTFEMLAVIEPHSATKYGVSIRCDQNGQNGIPITYDGTNLTIANVSFSFTFDVGETALFLHIFHDKSVLEVFANGGRAVSTQVVMPPLENQHIAAISEGGSALLKSADIWTLKSIW